MFVIKQNDTLPHLEARLIDADGNPINLDLCGVHFHMLNKWDSIKINRPVEIVDSELGDIRVIWQEGDTSESGMYNAEFEINMPNGDIISVPNDGYFIIKIVRELV